MEIKRKLKSQKILKAVTVGLLALTVANGTQLAYRMHESRQAENTFPEAIESLRSTDEYKEFINGYKDYIYKKYKDGKMSSSELSKNLDGAYENNELLKNYAYSLDDTDVAMALADNALEDAEAYVKESEASINLATSGFLTFIAYALSKRKLAKEDESSKETM